MGDATVVWASARWFKGEALGNDYLVFESGDAWPVTSAAVRAVCDRHRGVGADGIIVSVPPVRADYAVRVFNPDGSEAERSGNGLRIFAVAVVEGGVPALEEPGWGSTADRADAAAGKAAGAAGNAPGATGGAETADTSLLPATRRVPETGAPARQFTVEVGGDTVQIHVHGRWRDRSWDVSVEMGCASFEEDRVGFERARLESDPELEAWLHGGGPGVRGSWGRRPSRAVVLRAVSMGNPHCVVLGARWDEKQLRHLGPLLSHHPAFRRGTNVQLAWPVGKQRLRALVWERGTGETSASGSSACAVAAAAVKEGLVEAGAVDVEMPGGTLAVQVGPDFAITLRGPARAVCWGELSGGFLGTLRPGSGAEKAD